MSLESDWVLSSLGPRLKLNPPISCGSERFKKEKSVIAIVARDEGTLRKKNEDECFQGEPLLLEQFKLLSAG
jgi:hypothetical protein